MSVATKPGIIPFSAFPIIRPDSTFLFDHLVGKSEQFFRNFDTNRVRGFEVDHELDFVGCRTAFLTYQDCAQLGLEERSRGRFSSNVNGTTVCVSHVSGITGARRVIEGNIEYGYSWIICGWTSNSGLNLTVACWAIAVEAKMNINPAARENCTDFVIVFLPKGTPAGVGGVGLLNQPRRKRCSFNLTTEAPAILRAGASLMPTRVWKRARDIDHELDMKLGETRQRQ